MPYGIIIKGGSGGRPSFGYLPEDGVNEGSEPLVPGAFHQLNALVDRSVGWDVMQVDKLVGAQSHGHKNRAREGAVRAVQVAAQGVVDEQEVLHPC